MSEEDKKKILENYKVAENQKAKDEESDENSGEIPEKINSLQERYNLLTKLIKKHRVKEDKELFEMIKLLMNGNKHWRQLY